ncbi:ABC transporter permease [Ilumatobacter nonamiensis]|uniref:ABC transporter permease n=1 Tax=Ilumatobacter nonamiensis TaxID=467093 RepID=UPI0003488D7E|nr:ABC transporter permease [Ilumatobacter nonamiensis]
MNTHAVSLPLRIVPTAMLSIRRPQRMIERSAYVYRRGWLILLSGFFEPLLYLLSIRVGLSALVGDIEMGGRTFSYDEFVAPGLMAAAAMNGAVFECTANVFYKIKHSKLYEAVLATPMSAGDVALGEIGGAVVRSGLYAIAFAITMWALGLVASPWMVLAIPAAMLIGFTFASLGMALTTFMRSWEDFEYVPAITLPLFLFSTTFYPLSQYGEWAWMVGLSPLYHGVELVRAADLGVWDGSIIGHIAVLVGLSVVGLAVASRRIERLLLT